MFPKQLMCVHHAEHYFQNSVFNVIGYVKYKFKFFLVLRFLTSRWSVGPRSVHLVGWSVIGGQWSVGRLVGGFKETRKQREAAVRIETKSSSVWGLPKKKNKNVGTGNNPFSTLFLCLSENPFCKTIHSQVDLDLSR